MCYHMISEKAKMVVFFTQSYVVCASEFPVRLKNILNIVSFRDNVQDNGPCLACDKTRRPERE